MEKYLHMRLENYLNEKTLLTESAFFQKLLKKIGNKSTGTVKKFFRSNWIKLANIIKKQGVENDALQIINRHLKTSFRSLDQISKGVIKESKMDEDFKHYWEFMKDEAWPTLSFWPALQVWLQIDGLLKGSDFSLKATVVYAIFWAFLVSGKHIGQWFKWKKQNPEEHEAEGSKKHPFAI